MAQILNKPSLATVATSGDYDDLTNKPTIPSTAAEIGYDNTTSGLTATDVQDAIDEVNSSLAQLDDRVDYVTFGSGVDLSSYTGTNYYTFPCDGYVVCNCGASANAKAFGRIYDPTHNSPHVPVGGWSNSAYPTWSCFVKKGMRWLTVTLENSGQVAFVPLNG